MNHSSSHDVPAPTQPPEQILDSLARRLHDSTLRSRQIGELGEQYAAAWLESQGWRTLDRNWHCRYGELDVVSRNPMGQMDFSSRSKPDVRCATAPLQEVDRWLAGASALTAITAALTTVVTLVERLLLALPAGLCACAEAGLAA